MDKPPDYIIGGGGPVYTVTPQNELATEHLAERVGEDAQWLGNALVVEHRYIADFVQRLQGDGYTVRNNCV